MPVPVKLQRQDIKKKNTSRLKSVSSKIKDEVQRDIALYKYKVESSRNSIIKDADKVMSLNWKERPSEVLIKTDVDFLSQFGQTGNLVFASKNENKRSSHSKINVKIAEGIKEPNTIPLEDAQNIFMHLNKINLKSSENFKSQDHSKLDERVFEIADKFLNNPMVSYLSKNPGILTSSSSSSSILNRILSPKSLSRPESTTATYLKY